MFCNARSFKQKLCGDAWVHSKASKIAMFKGSHGSIPRAPDGCTSFPTQATTSHHTTRRPIPDRELIVRTPIVTPLSTSPAFPSTIFSTMTCSKCGTFAKSGRVSCCAPGGAWFKNCGGAANKNVDHRWFEGVQACKCKSMADVMSIDALADKAVTVCVFS